MVCPLFLLVHLPAKSIRSGGVPGSVPGACWSRPQNLPAGAAEIFK